MSRGPMLFGVAIPLVTLSTAFVALRFYCRHFVVQRVGPDDWIMLVALLNVYGIGAINVVQVKLGSGRHLKDLLGPQQIFDESKYIEGLKSWYFYQIEYLVTLFFVKISILAFYRRLSPAQGFQLAIKIVAGFVTIFTVAMVLVNAFPCPKDPSLVWAITYPKGCYDLLPVSYAQAAINIASDVVIFLLPLPSVLSLQLNKKNRVALLVVFSVGSVAVIASIARLSALVVFRGSKDPTYDGILVLLWSQVELNIAVICASAPAIRPLLTTLSGTLGSGKATYNRSASSGSGALARVNHHIALQTFGGSTRQLDPGSKNAIGGVAAASESGENIVTKDDGEGGSSGEVVSLDIRMERVEVEGDGRSESSGDLELGH